MKKLIALLLSLVLVLGLFAACNSTKPSETKGNEAITNPDDIADEMTSTDGKYQVAFITDVGQL